MGGKHGPWKLVKMMDTRKSEKVICWKTVSTTSLAGVSGVVKLYCTQGGAERSSTQTRATLQPQTFTVSIKYTLFCSSKSDFNV